MTNRKSAKPLQKTKANVPTVAPRTGSKCIISLEDVSVDWTIERTSFSSASDATVELKAKGYVTIGRVTLKQSSR